MKLEFKKKGSRKTQPKIFKIKDARIKTSLHKLGYPQPPYTVDQLEILLKNITVKYIISLEGKVTNDWHLFAEYNNTIDTLRASIKKSEKAVEDIKDCMDIIVERYEVSIKELIEDNKQLRAKFQRRMN